MKAQAFRRHRLAPIAVALFGLLIAGLLYAVLSPQTAQASGDVASVDDVAEGEALFQANCATCHGSSAQGRADGPSLVGVGAAAVHFQVSTGRMPMQAHGPQAPAKTPQFNEEQTLQLAAFVASLGAGPSIPTEDMVNPELGDPANGMALFRTNCAMCHNAVGKGGALSNGKWAPSLVDTSPTAIYEAMLTGPQSMPAFNDVNITPEGKRDIIAYIAEQQKGSPGGNDIGSLGPVGEGVWAWILGMGLLIGATVWVGSRSS